MKSWCNAVPVFLCLLAATTELSFHQVEGVDNNFRGMATAHDRSLTAVASCPLDDTESMLTVVNDYIDNADTCASGLDKISDAFETLIAYYTVRDNLKAWGAALSVTLTEVNRVMIPVKIMLKKIPVYGPMMTTCFTVLMKIGANVGRLADDDTDYESRKTIATAFNTQIERAQTLAGYASSYGQTVESVVSSGMAMSRASSCCGTNSLNTYANITYEHWEAHNDALEVCAGAFEFDFPSFEIEFDMAILNNITVALRKMTDFMEELSNKVADDAKYFKCCSGFGTTMKEAFGDLKDMFNVLTCWVAPLVDGIIDEAMDVLLDKVQDLIDNQIDTRIGPLNSLIEDVNSIEITVPDLNLEYPSISYGEEQCELLFGQGTWDIGLITVSTNIPNISGIDLGADGVYSFSDIGKDIMEACGEAADAFGVDADTDCCPAARVAKNISIYGKEIGDSCGWTLECESERCDATGDGKECMARIENCGGGCNEDTDCVSENCREGTCADINGYICQNNPCTSSGQCSTGRCDTSSVGKSCLAKLSNCHGGCNEGSDCLSGSCIQGYCTHSNGKACVNNPCSWSSQCGTSRCDSSSNGKVCQYKVNSCGTCNENSDCHSNMCRLGSCAYTNSLICNSRSCTSSSQCNSGRCDNLGGGKKCYAKLPNGYSCNEGSDCLSSKCRWGKCKA